ncbi:uncharacterized protein LOC141851321 [Brevipalpus obovatus]|uniref:uncharacterized protein LOC141851321 n=1 Tax=Brevipalpus obovatus TaxID=246614 RepID=UPI003D9DB212
MRIILFLDSVNPSLVQVLVLIYGYIAYISCHPIDEKFNFKRELTADNSIACDPDLQPFLVPEYWRIGRIITEGYPTEAYYPINLTCSWIIQAPEGKWIDVFLHDFGLDKDDRAVVQFFVQQEEERQLIQEFRGHFKVSQHFIAPTNRLEIIFRGVDEPRAKGFEIYYEHKAPPLSDCDHILAKSLKSNDKKDDNNNNNNDQDDDDVDGDGGVDGDKDDVKNSIVQYDLNAPIAHRQCDDGDNQTIVDPNHRAFLCRNQEQCFLESERCNGVDNCWDGTDEENCDHEGVDLSDQVIDLPGWFRDKIAGHTCGNPSIKPVTYNLRILGGEKVIPGSWPWMASIRLKKAQPVGHVCGATVINRYWLLTAAHCFPPISNLSKYEIHLGRFNSIVSITGHEVVRYIDRLIPHPEFNYTLDYDIALIRMNAPIPSDDEFIQPLCLPSSDTQYNSLTTSFITGWGNINSHNEELFLRQASLLIFTNQHCQNIYSKRRISDKILCAGRYEGGIDSCKGDSGGPMVVMNPVDRRWSLAGIVSSGAKNCGQRGKPGLYTNVGYFRDWIDQTMLREEGKPLFQLMNSWILSGSISP